jgi:hypothetical protein
VFVRVSVRVLSLSVSVRVPRFLRPCSSVSVSVRQCSCPVRVAVPSLNYPHTPRKVKSKKSHSISISLLHSCRRGSSKKFFKFIPPLRWRSPAPHDLSCSRLFCWLVKRLCKSLLSQAPTLVDLYYLDFVFLEASKRLRLSLTQTVDETIRLSQKLASRTAFVKYAQPTKIFVALRVLRG